MRSMTARDANQDFSTILAEVEKGEIILITKNGRTVAEHGGRPMSGWLRLMRETPATGFRVGKVTEDDKYGDAPS